MLLLHSAPRFLVASGLAALLALWPAAPHAAGTLHITTEARGLQPGELVVVTIDAERPLEAARVRAFGEDVDAFQLEPSTWRAFVGIDLDVKPGAYTLSVTGKAADGPIRASEPLRVVDKSFPTRRLKVDESFVNPPAEVTQRILREARELDAIWHRSTGERLWSRGFVRPVSQAANSRFGSRSIYNGQPRSPHGGADFLSPAGTPVGAPNAGRIVVARDLYYTGNTIVIDHGLGLYSVLAHLSAMNVEAGDLVEAGQIIGKVGATGRVTGAHLHWGIRLAGARIDPLSVLALAGR